MELTCEHNLNEQELAKALHGIAEAEGISEELVKALRKTSACDLTPKKPKDKAIRQIYDMLTAEFAKAAADVQMYAEHLLTLKKSQLSFDFTAPLRLGTTTDKSTGHLVHRWMADHHSAQQASPVVEQPQEEPTVTDLKEQLEAYKSTLSNQYAEHTKSVLNHLKSAFGPDLRGTTANKTALANSTLYKVWEKIRGMTQRDANSEVHISPHAVEDSANRYADATIEAWHGKITGKIKDLQNSTVHHLDGSRFMISGERDGKKITIEQDMIINRSTNGLLFNQFPARIYVDGKFHSEAAYKKLTGDDAVEKQAKAGKDAEKRVKNMLPSGKFAKGDKVRLKLVRKNGEKYETEGTVSTERNGKTMVIYGGKFNKKFVGVETDKLERWQK